MLEILFKKFFLILIAFSLFFIFYIFNLNTNLSLNEVKNQAISDKNVIYEHPSSGYKEDDKSFDGLYKFKIYKGEQSGTYTYDLRIDSTKQGIVFLKAFEVETGLQLSSDSLKKQSSILLERDNFNPGLASLNDTFKIYEGDWGNYYKAKFELWFESKELRNQEKIAEKFYIIEGWER